MRFGRTLRRGIASAWPSPPPSPTSSPPTWARTRCAPRWLRRRRRSGERDRTRLRATDPTPRLTSMMVCKHCNGLWQQWSVQNKAVWPVSSTRPGSHRAGTGRRHAGDQRDTPRTPSASRARGQLSRAPRVSGPVSRAPRVGESRRTEAGRRRGPSVLTG